MKTQTVAYNSLKEISRFNCHLLFLKTLPVEASAYRSVLFLKQRDFFPDHLDFDDKSLVHGLWTGIEKRTKYA